MGEYTEYAKEIIEQRVKRKVYKKVLLILIPTLLGLLLSFLLVTVVVSIIAEDQRQNQAAAGYSNWFDPIGYLSAKYESGANPDDTGGDGGNAYGKYQLDYRYDLQDFIDWAYNRSPVLYAEFSQFANQENGDSLRANEALYSAWHAIYARDALQFEADQDEFMANVYYYPSLSWLNIAKGINLDTRSDALKAVVFSHAVRNGPGISLREFIGGCNGFSSDETIIKTMYAHSRSVHPGEVTRWTLEEQDALALLAGTLNIYEPSENAAGSIDWSYKLVHMSDATSTTEVAGISLNQRLAWLFPAGLPKNAAAMQQYLVQVEVPIWNEQGKSTTMTLTVHKKLATEIKSIFMEMMQVGFKVKASDTCGYNWRQMVSSSSISHHSYGCVIDLNWNDNPYISGGLVVGSNAYQPGTNPYSVTAQVVSIWKRHGFYWGGDWSSSKDYMHFTYTNH